MLNKFPEGSIVRAKINPTQKLIIRRYVDRVYFCKLSNNLEAKELAYFERELMT